MSSPWAERALASFSCDGSRQGSARVRVVEYLDEQSCCVGAQELHDALRALGRPVGLASVYRVVDMLAQAGLLQRLELGDGVTRYEPLRIDEEHHHHLVCDSCGKVEPFASHRLENVIRDVEQESGYAVAGHDVVLRGACTACR